eukprot:Skav213977  [mRNA]  locus=scaffold2200:430534:432771:- [translate_table: standard]
MTLTQWSLPGTCFLYSCWMARRFSTAQRMQLNLWLPCGFQLEHLSQLKAALDWLIEKMVVDLPFSFGRIELDAKSAALVRDILQYWQQLPPGSQPQWLEKSEDSCMKVDCCRLMGRWNPCVQQYFRTKTLARCDKVKVGNLTWNPTMCHPKKAVIAGSIPFRCFFLQDLTQDNRHAADSSHQTCLGQKMLEMVHSMLAEASEGSERSSYIILQALSIEWPSTIELVVPLKASFKFHVGDALEVQPQTCFDVILTSNLADYVGVPKILDHLVPLLRNEQSTLVTEFMNWRESHFHPTTEVEVQKIRAGSTRGDPCFCDRALRFSRDFPSPQLPFSAMLDCFFFRELLHRVKCRAAKSFLSCDMQKMQLHIQQFSAAGHVPIWEEKELMEILTQFAPLMQEILLAGWGVARKVSGTLFPHSFAVADCLWASGHERTVEWGIPKCCRQGCDASDKVCKRCTSCQKVWYCSVSCQREAWPLHKLFCKGELECGRTRESPVEKPVDKCAVPAEPEPEKNQI